MFDQLADAEPMELQAWMLGAAITGLGLGTIAARKLRRYAPWIIAGGLVVHGWGMYRIYGRR